MRQRTSEFQIEFFSLPALKSGLRHNSKENKLKMGGKTEIVDRDYFRIPWDGLMSLPIAFCAIPILGFAPNILNPYLSESLMKNIVYYQVRPIKMYLGSTFV